MYFKFKNNRGNEHKNLGEQNKALIFILENFENNFFFMFSVFC
jgi:hypothetical protein